MPKTNGRAARYRVTLLVLISACTSGAEYQTGEGRYLFTADAAGRRLDINGNVVPPESPAAHLPLGES
jgi:hypothetical protein